MHKKIELEMLFNSLNKLSDQGKIRLNLKIKEQLRAEGTRSRNKLNSSLLTSVRRLAAKNLKNNRDIVIRKADKSNTFVILNHEDYISKLENILKDTTKFQEINRDPTKQLKAEVNRLIESANAVLGEDK